MTALTEAEAKLQLRSVEQLNASNALNRFKFDAAEHKSATTFDEYDAWLRSELRRVFRGDRS